MKYGLLALLVIGLIPGCTCGRKKSGEKAKTHKMRPSRKKPSPKRSKRMPKEGMAMSPQQRMMDIQSEMLESEMMEPGMQF